MALTASQKMDVIARTEGGSVNTYTITDTSDYAFNNESVSDYVGVLKITIPGGTVVYENTNYSSPDITVGEGSKTFPLPLDVDGNVITGDYIVTLSVRNKNTLVVTSNTTTYEYDYIAPTVSIDLSADGFNSTITSKDDTDYGTLSVVYDHTVAVPIGSDLVDQTSTTAQIDISANIWSGTYTTSLVNTVTYTHDYLTVVDVITGTESLLVYNLSRNTVFDAITSFNEIYNATVGTNPPLARTYAVISNRISGYVAEYQRGVEENDGQKCYDALTAISLLLWPDFIDDLFTTTEEIIPFDFRVSTDAEAIAFIQALTVTTEEINVLKGLNVAAGRIIYSDSSKLVSDDDFTIDELGLHIPAGSKYYAGNSEYIPSILTTSNIWSGDENDFSRCRLVVNTLSVDTETAEAASTAFVINQGYAKLASPSFTGKVAIGIATAKVELHVLGTSALPASSGTTPAGMFLVGGSSNGMYFGMDGSSPYSGWIQAADRDNLATTYPILLNPRGGNIYIGKTTGTYKLDIDGDINVDIGHVFRINGTEQKSGTYLLANNNTWAGINTFNKRVRLVPQFFAETGYAPPLNINIQEINGDEVEAGDVWIEGEYMYFASATTTYKITAEEV
jgi:hypothetical protein